MEFLTHLLEHLVDELGSQDVRVYNALTKTIIDIDNHLTTNPYYDSKVVGKHCEKRDPTLAVFGRGQCDDELVNVTNRNSLFKLQARYVVESMEPVLWSKVLNRRNPFRRQLIDQVVQSVGCNEFKREQVAATVIAFMSTVSLHELIELLENIVLQNSAFNGNSYLENLLIATAIKAHTSRVLAYINRLDKFAGPAMAVIAVEEGLYEEAFAIFGKFNRNVQAVSALLYDNRNIDRAVKFATRVKEDEVWSQVGKAQLRQGLASDAIESFIKANDATQFNEVIDEAPKVRAYELVQYLLMVRKKVKHPKVDAELIYFYAKMDRLEAIEEFIRTPNVANFQTVGNRLSDEALDAAAKIILAHVSAKWASIASNLLEFHQYQDAVDAARKANSSKTWKEVAYACVDARESELAQICAGNVDCLREDVWDNRWGQVLEIIFPMEDYRADDACCCIGDGDPSVDQCAPILDSTGKKLHLK